jgi:ADP-heptose:LPS heptosyltransferase
MFSIPSLLHLDQRLALPYRLFRYVYLAIRKCYSAGHQENNRAVVLKLLGMGSIIRMVSIWEENQVDITTIQLCTFRQNQEICEILGLQQTIYIHQQNPVIFLADIFRALWLIRQFRPQYLLDLERCSHAVGIFRMAGGLLTGAKTLSLNKQKDDTNEKNDWEWSLHRRTYGEAIQQATRLLTKIPLNDDESQSNRRNVRKESLVCSHKILVNVNASAYLPERRYPLSYFADLLQALQSRPVPYTFYLTGSAEERDYVQLLEDLLEQRGIEAYNVAGLWNLRELVYHLSDCRVFITNDSGPMHLATYLQIPTVALWGPTHYRYFGYKNNVYTQHISLEMPCTPCFTDPTTKVAMACGGKITCMKELHPERIARAVELGILRQPPFRTWLVPQGMKVYEFRSLEV